MPSRWKFLSGASPPGDRWQILMSFSPSLLTSERDAWQGVIRSTGSWNIMKSSPTTSHQIDRSRERAPAIGCLTLDACLFHSNDWAKHVWISPRLWHLNRAPRLIVLMVQRLSFQTLIISKIPFKGHSNGLLSCPAARKSLVVCNLYQLLSDIFLKGTEKAKLDNGICICSKSDAEFSGSNLSPVLSAMYKHWSDWLRSAPTTVECRSVDPDAFNC